MSLRFAYKLQSSPQAVVPLGGRWVRPRPLISISLIGPAGTYVKDAHLDTGSDDTVLPEAVAATLGVDLTNAPTGRASRVGMAPVLLRYAEVTLRITDGNERREWTAWVGFTPAPLKRPLLGFAGFLQFFTVTFHGDREEVELAVSSLYRGT